MKSAALILLFVFCSVECRKILPINKNANIDFINMESGGMRVQPAVQAPAAKPSPAAAPVVPKPVAPAPARAPAPACSLVIPPGPAQPAPTPGPGSVQTLINYYDSQGKASPIRPYSYSQAVKQG